MTRLLSRSPRVRKYAGPNGITILQQDNPNSRAVCVGVWINTGSRDERRGEEGLSHFLEHMVFKGTDKRTPREISQEIEKVGGALEAFTTKEQICVYAQVLEDHAALAIDVLGDMLMNSTFAPEHVEVERQVVLEEIDDVNDAPDDLIHDLFAAEVFPNHPLGRPILGTPETVSSFDRAALRRFAKRSLRADNIVVSVYGNVPKRRLMPLLEKSFAFTNGRVTKRSARPRRHMPARRHERRKLHHQHICIGGQGFAFLDDKRYALLVLSTLLGGSMSSRLFQRIREELGLAYAVYAYADAARDTGLFGTYVAVKPKNTGLAIKEIFREFDKIRRGELSAEELNDTKEHLKGRILLGLETSSAKMMRMARNEVYFGRQISERELIKKIDRVDMDDVLELSRTLLDRDKATIVSLGPSAAGLA